MDSAAPARDSVSPRQAPGLGAAGDETWVARASKGINTDFEVILSAILIFMDLAFLRCGCAFFSAVSSEGYL